MLIANMSSDLHNFNVEMLKFNIGTMDLEVGIKGSMG